MQKRTFILLEIMIAMALITSCLLPFFHHPFRQSKQELSTLFEMELERVSQNALTDLQTRLFKKEIPEERIFGDKKIKAPLATKRITVYLSPTIKREYDEKRYVSWEKQKLADDRQITALVHLKVVYTVPKKRRIVHQAETDLMAQKRM